MSAELVRPNLPNQPPTEASLMDAGATAPGLQIPEAQSTVTVQHDTYRRVVRRAVATTLALALTGGAELVAADPALAACSGTRCDAAGTVELSGSNWLSGNGVDVYSNGASVDDDAGNSYVTVNGTSVLAGEEWQCVELINRLYLTHDWITGHWHGNGEDLYANAPSNLTKEANGSITQIAPGDVLSLGDDNTGTTNDDGGHATVVNTVTVNSDNTETVQLVNQNTPVVGSTAILSDGNLTMSGWKNYYVIGVIEAPGSAVTPPAVTDGEYIKSASTGEVYIVAGGSPIGLPTWDSVGGTKTIGATLTQAQIDAMPKVPRDGTFVEAYNSPTVYEIAGGAAFGVPSSASVGNSIGTIDEIPDGTSFRQHPSDGTFVEEYGSSTVYESVGGAAIAVPSWASVGLPDQQHVAMIPDGGLGQFASQPADGTFVQNYGSSTVYEIAGGAAFGIPTPSAVGGNVPTPVEIPDSKTFPSQPADGTYVEPYGSSTVYLTAAGAAMPLPSWSSVGGTHNVAQIPAGGLGQFLAEPRDGTFVAEYGSPAVYEMAGGAAMPLANWASVGGQESTVMIPDGDVAGIPSKPANGTFVEPYGSPTVEEIAGGAAFPLSNWSQVGGSKTVDQVPAGTTFASLPANGTYIEEYGSPTVAVTAGGAALDITSWSAVGGSEPVTTIPSGAIASDLLAYPQNGTYVRGYGSGDEFEAMNGSVTQVTTTPLPAATTVDDWAIINQLGGTE